MREQNLGKVSVLEKAKSIIFRKETPLYLGQASLNSISYTLRNSESPTTQIIVEVDGPAGKEIGTFTKTKSGKLEQFIEHPQS